MPFMSSELYSAARVYLIILWSLLRIFSTKSLLQTFLENAKEKAIGCSKHADGFEALRSHLSYLCATSLQLLTPAIVILYTALTLISLGNIYIF